MSDDRRPPLTELASKIDLLEAELAAARAELSALAGASAPRRSNPRSPMDPEARRALFRRLAAEARARKRVGQGRDAVSPDAKRKLVRDVKRMEKPGP
jgi:hypothetical protein